MNDGKWIHVSLNQNPIVRQLAKYTIASDSTTSIQIYISNAQEKIVKNRNFHINEGSTFIDIDISGDAKWNLFF